MCSFLVIIRKKNGLVTHERGNCSFQAHDDRKDCLTLGGLLATPAEQHASPVPVLPHPRDQLSPAGERAVLQHLLPQASVRHRPIPRLAYQRPCEYAGELLSIIGRFMNFFILLVLCLLTVVHVYLDALTTLKMVYCCWFFLCSMRCVVCLWSMAASAANARKQRIGKSTHTVKLLHSYFQIYVAMF